MKLTFDILIGSRLVELNFDVTSMVCTEYPTCVIISTCTFKLDGKNYSVTMNVEDDVNLTKSIHLIWHYINGILTNASTSSTVL